MTRKQICCQNKFDIIFLQIKTTTRKNQLVMRFRPSVPVVALKLQFEFVPLVAPNSIALIIVESLSYS